MNERNWIWLPHAAHFCGAHECRFRMATCVGKYIVSTVGQYDPKHTGVFEEIGFRRLYETMVFIAKEATVCKTCPVEISCHDDLETESYNDGKAAFAGHLAMCRKWSKKK